MNAGIYIHIPFCLSRCVYCGFNSRHWRAETAGRYCRTLVEEIKAFSSRMALRSAVDTVYFGGGTPSILPPEWIAMVLDACRRHLPLVDGAEISLESNPGTLDAPKAASYIRVGINRISLGAQAFSDAELETLGRIHRVAEIAESVRLLRAHGYANINLDLMLGLPQQTRDSWNRSLAALEDLNPSHVSVYMLDLDAKAPLYWAVKNGAARLPDDDDVSDWYLCARDRLREAGFGQYEISNFAKPGFECRHNIKYWRRDPVYGFGLGSHSFDGRRRYANIGDLDEYTAAVDAGRPPTEWEKALSPDEEREETFFLGLRMASGLDWTEVERRFPPKEVELCRSILRELAGAGLIEWEIPNVRLTPEGMLLSNEVLQRFVRMGEG